METFYSFNGSLQKFSKFIFVQIGLVVVFAISSFASEIIKIHENPPRSERYEESLLTFLTSSTVDFFLTKEITGQVLDESGVPLIGVNISIKGTSNGAVTDIDGNFTLSILR